MVVTQNLRIVHCFRSPVGGIFRHVRDLAQAQVAAGHAVGIVCDSTTGGEFEERLFDEMKEILALGVWRTPMQRHVGPGDIAAAWRTYRIIKELKPDVLHGHGAKGGVYARMFGSLLRVSRSRVARLYSPHGGSLHYDEGTLTGKLFFGLERLMERFIVPRTEPSVNAPVISGAAVTDVPETAADVGPLQPPVLAVVPGEELGPRVQSLTVVDQQGGTRLELDLVSDLAAGGLQCPPTRRWRPRSAHAHRWRRW